ncbi:MAG: glycoside hydrolase family 99-like domain-containing protein [Clostridia bacterium]|nr:glycoside hydrolase family 99-like domain-containing protein [Clostridia bacterium]
MKGRKGFLALSTLLACSIFTGVAVGAESAKEPQWLLESGGKWAAPIYESTNNPTGWNIDRRGGEVTETNNSSINILDSSDEYPIIMTHAVENRSSGELTYECKLKFMDIYKGFSLDLMNEKGERAVSFGIDNGWLVYEDGKKGNVRVVNIDENVWYRVKAIANLDNKTAEISIGGTLIGVQSFTEDTDEISLVRVKTPEEKEMSVQIAYMNMYENYLINEGFFAGEFPYDWECVSVETDAVSVTPMSTGDMAYQNLTIKDTNIIDNTVVRKVFDKSSGLINCEFRFLGGETANGMSFMLKNENETAVKLSLSKGYLVNNSGERLTEVSSHMWHILRIEANTETNTAVIKYNGRKLVEMPFDETCQYIDRLEFATSVKGRGEITIRDVVAYVEPELPSDYPTEPEVPADPDNTIVCMQVCDLWHEHHIGWDSITAYENRIPYLGWYDDTKPEVSDWEIKWMTEHGVDATLKCWYMEEGNYTGKPLNPIASNSAMNAFYNAKYTDYIKYGLIVCSYPAKNDPVNHWRNGVVPYWIEQFFKDDRYLVVDNKPVIFMFGWNAMEKSFGSIEKMNEEINYLREECKKAGFDGAYLIGYCAQTKDGGAEMTKAKNAGFDYAFLYSWGPESYMASHQINGMENHKAMNVLDSIPNITVGYNKSGWEGLPEVEYATSETFMEVAQYIKNDLMPRFDKSSLSSRMVTLDNWNEWGEGHYISPSTLNGFGYLDVVREVFTEGGEHTDDIPTENQKNRLNNRYPNDRKWLKYIELDKKTIPTKVNKGWYFNNESDFNEWKIEKQLESIEIKDGAMAGKSSDKDGGIVMVNDLGLDISNSPYIKIRMKTSAQSSDIVEIFFTTVENNTWTQLQSARCDASLTGDYTDYYFDMESNKYWNGVLNKLRFDMSKNADTQFSIESIEILENETLPISLSVDGAKQSYKGEAIITNGTTLVPTWPHKGYQDALHCAVFYNNKYKTVTFTHSDAEIVFTIGSDIATVNGVEYKLNAPIEIVNNLPNLPIRFIAEAIGGTVAWNGETNTIEITTKESQSEPEIVYDISQRVPNQWEFELKGDLEDWTASTQFYFSRARVEDGVLALKSMSTDPQISHKVEIDASSLKTIKVGVKNESSSNIMQIFFASTASGGISAANSVKQTISTKDEEFVEYTFDMSQNENWKGTVTQLRIDPINGTGAILFDYIRIE